MNGVSPRLVLPASAVTSAPLRRLLAAAEECDRTGDTEKAQEYRRQAQEKMIRQMARVIAPLLERDRLPVDSHRPPLRKD